MSEGARRQRWGLIALIGGVCLVVVIALVAVFARGGPAEFAEDTPVGVVQRYSQAVIDGDADTARTYLVAEVADSCTRVRGGSEDYRMTLVETTEHERSARVDVLIATVYESGPLGTNEFESDESFELVREGDGWLIEVAPWQLTICEEGFR